MPVRRPLQSRMNGLKPPTKNRDARLPVEAKIPYGPNEKCICPTPSLPLDPSHWQSAMADDAISVALNRAQISILQNLLAEFAAAAKTERANIRKRVAQELQDAAPSADRRKTQKVRGLSIF